MKNKEEVIVDFTLPNLSEDQISDLKSKLQSFDLQHEQTLGEILNVLIDDYYLEMEIGPLNNVRITGTPINQTQDEEN